MCTLFFWELFPGVVSRSCFKWLRQLSRLTKLGFLQLAWKLGCLTLMMLTCTEQRSSRRLYARIWNAMLSLKPSKCIVSVESAMLPVFPNLVTVPAHLSELGNQACHVFKMKTCSLFRAHWLPCTWCFCYAELAACCEQTRLCCTLHHKLKQQAQQSLLVR